MWNPFSEKRSFEVLKKFLTFVNGDGTSSVSVTREGALGISAYWCGVRSICETLASVPINVIKSGDGTREVAYDNPIHRLFAVAPNRFMSPFIFREVLFLHLLIHGNFYALLIRDNSGKVVEAWPLDPTTVQMMRSGSTFYYQTNLIGTSGSPESRKVPIEDILHIPGMGFDGYTGFSPLAVFKDTFRFAISARDYGTKFFANGGQPAGILSSETTMTEEEIAANHANWVKATTGKNTAGTAVLTGGLTYQPISVPPDQAQFIQTRMFTVTEVARILNIPPTKLHDLSNGTYSNVGQESLAFVQDTLMPWSARLESVVNFRLLSGAADDKLNLEISLDPLLAGDRKQRFQTHMLGIAGGFMSPEEARLFEKWATKPAVGKLLELENAGQINPAFGDQDTPNSKD